MFMSAVAEKSKGIRVERVDIDAESGYSPLFYDFLDHVRGKQSCHLAEYAYAPGNKVGDELDGITHFERLAQDPNYPGNRELSFLKDIFPEVARHLPNTMTALEIGPGSVYLTEEGEERLAVGGQKTEAFIDAIKDTPFDGEDERRKTKSVGNYIALDVAESSAINGAKFAHDKYGMGSSHIVTDYRTLAQQIREGKEERPLMKSDNSTPMIFCFGNTPFNIAKTPKNRVETEIANCMADLGEIGGPGSIVVLTHFRKLDATVYKGEHNRKAIMSIWHRIAGDPAIDNLVPEEGWEPYAEEDESDNAIVMGVESTLKTRSKIYLNSMEKAPVELGTRFDLARSLRPSVETVQRAAEFQGFETLYNNKDDADSEFGIHVLRYNP